MNQQLHATRFLSPGSRLSFLLTAFCLLSLGPRPAFSQYSSQKNILVQSGAVWIPDNGDGTYTNPVLFADYSDPDVICVGDDYYLVASSFSHFPGLPILHSKDLVNWKIIAHAARRYPVEEFSNPQHGMGIWAPSLRHHNGMFYIYYGDPDRGVFMTKAPHPSGPWTPLKLVRKVTGWIDPCPFWDEDGQAYLVHAWANSRAGIKSILAINRMNDEGTAILDDGVVVFVGHFTHPTIEGPKLYKRNGYYYIFAPAGGVKNGWQAVLRSRHIFGPYEDKVVLEQGSTPVNGPHQGAWVTTAGGENWFLHFQDRGAYGRIVHLQPMRWERDWPVIGKDVDGNGIGEPVAIHEKPAGAAGIGITVPQTSDEFSSSTLGLQWQWQANEQESWYSLSEKEGWLRLFAEPLPEGPTNLWDVGSLLLEKLPAPSFTVTTRIDAQNLQPGERAGLVAFGLDYASIAVERTDSSWQLRQIQCLDADCGSPEFIVAEVGEALSRVMLRVAVEPSHGDSGTTRIRCAFSYSVDGSRFVPLGISCVAREGKWVGAKIGLYASGKRKSDSQGYADFDWFRFSR